MNVTVTMEIPAARLPDLATALAAFEGETREVTPVPVPEVPAVVAAPVPEVPTASVTVTKTMIRARGLDLTKAGKSAELGEIFKKFGAEKLSGLKEENYEEAYGLMGALL